MLNSSSENIFSNWQFCGYANGIFNIGVAGKYLKKAILLLMNRIKIENPVDIQLFDVENQSANFAMKLQVKNPIG